MLPNDNSKLKTPELSSDMLNALAVTVAERLKATLQPSIEHKQGQRSVSDDAESGIASHFFPLCEKHMTGPHANGSYTLWTHILQDLHR